VQLKSLDATHSRFVLSRLVWSKEGVAGGMWSKERFSILATMMCRLTDAPARPIVLTVSPKTGASSCVE
jgi:hypothetical protein